LANKKYVKGANFERQFIADKEKEYICVRSAGSHSAIDVVLIPRGMHKFSNIILCQLKTYKKGKVKPKPDKAFVELDCGENCTKWWVTRQDYKPVQVEIVDSHAI